MPYQIDQSGKIEHTNKDTVLAIANGKSFSVLLRAKEKRILQEIFKTFYNKKRQYVYEVFSALTYILLSSVKLQSHIMIDKEYPGKESLIKLYILQYDKEKKLSSEDIFFGLVGKSSLSHKVAYKTFTKKIKPSKVVRIEEVMSIIFSTKKTGYSSISGTEDS